MNDFNPIYYVVDSDAPAGDSPIRKAPIAILVGHGDRAWMEARVSNGQLRPIGRIETVIPERPDFDAALLDALLAFWPARFRSCPSLATVEAELEGEKVLDFNLGADRISPAWEALRREARPTYRRLIVVRVDGAISTSRPA